MKYKLFMEVVLTENFKPGFLTVSYEEENFKHNLYFIITMFIK